MISLGYPGFVGYQNLATSPDYLLGEAYLSAD